MHDDLTARIRRYLSSAPTSMFTGHDVVIREGWQGADNLLWRVQSTRPGMGDEAVVKLFLDAGQARSRRQFDGQQTFAPAGLAPDPLWVDRYPVGLARQILVYRWVEGEAPSSSGTDMDALTESVGALHSADPSALRRFCPHPINLDFYWRVQVGSVTTIQEWLASRHAPHFTTIFTALAGAAQRLVEHSMALWHGAPPAPVHGDLRLENSVMAGGAAVLLDWEMFGLGDPSLDAATFLHRHQHELSDAGCAQWLETYRRRVGQSGLAERIEVYRRLLPFQAVCFLMLGLMAHSAGSDSQSEMDQFLAATLTAALERSASVLETPLAASPTAAVAELYKFASETKKRNHL